MTWYRNGNIARQYDWSKGTPVNMFEERREDGSLACKGAYKDGKLHGTVNWYGPNGEVTASEKYRNGELVKKKEKKDKKDKTGKPEDKMTPAGTTAPVAAAEKKKKGLFRSGKDRDTTVQVTPPPAQTGEQAPKGKAKRRSQVKENTQQLQQNPSPVQQTPPDQEKKKKRRKKDTADDPQTP